MAIKKIKLPGMAQPVDIGTTWANVSGKPDLMTSSEISAAINAAFATNDAMVFKGTIGAGGTVTQLPATHEAGWTYKVISNGSLAGQTCEIGDMIVCIADGEVATADDWTVIQTNVDGAVTGPASSTAGHIATFTGTTGKAIQDSGFTIAKNVPADAQFTDTTYENKTAVSGGTDVSLVSTGEKYNWNNSVVISDTQPTGNGNKLWVDTDAGSENSYQVPTVAESLAMGISGAKVGDLVRVNSVDANGKPTSWKKVPLNEIKCNHNYLENWDFTNPVNQRGQQSYSTTGHCIDRWWRVFGVTTIVDGGISIADVASEIYGPAFRQALSDPKKFAGKTVTISVLIDELVDGTVTIGCTKSSGMNSGMAAALASKTVNKSGLVTITGTLPNDVGGDTYPLLMATISIAKGATCKLRGAKFELGSEQSLARNEGTEQNPVWVLNEVPDYGEELRKCQRYFVRINPGAWGNIGFTYAANENTCSTLVALPTTMAQNPVVTFNGDLLVKNAVTSTRTTGHISGSSISFVIATTGLTAYATNVFRAGPNGGYIDISAEP